ncbi:MAG: hypothetical protein LH645_14310 [Actinomycetia bacterium]|nr:hypothetical protein [Actinomycetes bacterium]
MNLFRHLSRMHGVDRRWFLLLAVCWALVVLAGWIGLPQIDPNPVDRTHPLEQLSTFALLLPVMVQISSLTIYSPWVEQTRAVRLRALQPLWLAFHWSAGVATTMVLSLWVLPYGVDSVHAAGVWGLLFAIGSLASSGRTESSLRFSALALFAVLAVMTFPGLLPFSANLFYNAETTILLWIVTAAITVAAVVVPVARGM